jgi:hypothetical protein
MAGTMNAARADAIDSPAATTNAREYPALSATVTGTPPWPAASAACARSVAIVASTARPREPPICREVLSTPEASPASVMATPAVAAAASGVNSKPRASDAHRQERQAGSQGAVTEDVLQVEGQEVPHREERGADRT